MPAAPPPRYLIRRRRTWAARMTIPPDVHAILGRKFFLASTGQTEANRAAAVAAPWLVEWRERIVQARQSLHDPVRAEIERLSSAYRGYRGAALDDAGAALAADVVEFLFERLGGLTPEQRRQALTEARGNVAGAMRTLPDPARADAVLTQITGTATHFLAHLKEWKEATHLRGKTLAQAESAICKFARAVPEPIERLQGGNVQKWIDGLLRPKSGRPVTSATVNSYLSGIRAYWEWMQSRDFIPAEQRPFWGRKVNGGRNDAETTDDKRDRFKPAEVVRLWKAAEAKGDPMLAAAIRIAAYSGIRREGACTLRVDSIMLDSDTGIEFMHVAEETAAGVRDVPTHSAILQATGRVEQEC